MSAFRGRPRRNIHVDEREGIAASRRGDERGLERAVERVARKRGGLFDRAAVRASLVRRAGGAS